MKKVLVTASLVVASLVTSASAAEELKLSKIEKATCNYLKMQPEKIRKEKFCRAKKGDVATTVVLASYIKGEANALEKLFGDFSTTTKKLAGGTGISINLNYENWIWNFRSFVCSLTDEQLKKFSIFMQYVDWEDVGGFYYKKFKEFYNKNPEKYAKVIKFLETKRGVEKFKRIMTYQAYAHAYAKTDEDLYGGSTFLAKLFFKHKFTYTDDPAIAKFVGAIAQKDFQRALEIIENDERVIEGYNYFNRLCK